jgi:hypothetical protein
VVELPPREDAAPKEISDPAGPGLNFIDVLDYLGTKVA